MRGVAGEGLGLAAGLGAATCFALSTALTGLSYLEGNAPMTLVVARYLAVVALVYPWLLLIGGSLLLPRSAWGLMAGMTAGSLGISYGYMTAIHYLPVSLAVLIFYTFPLLVTLAESLLRRRPPNLFLLLALGLGLFGLGLALGADLSQLDLVGILFAGLAAFSAVPLFICARILAQKHGSLMLTAHSNCCALIVAVILLMGQAEIDLPHSTLGWFSLLAACVTFVAAFIFQVRAVALAPAGRVAMMFNAEPLITILIAWGLLSQALALPQWLGLLLILVALSLAVTSQRR
ncbi:MAG: EamA family transporter [Pseudomonadota bacterium]